MSSPDQALATQLANIEKRTGKSLQQLAQLIRASGLSKHGEIRDLLKRDLGMGHGDANTLTHFALQTAGVGMPAGPSPEQAVEAIYTGAKATLRPIHDRLMAEITAFGPCEIAPKKSYLSLRRKKQFATVGPATHTKVEVGLNVKGLQPTGRLEALPPNSMCAYRVRLSSASEVDPELVGWIRQAFDAAG